MDYTPKYYPFDQVETASEDESWLIEVPLENVTEFKNIADEWKNENKIEYSILIEQMDDDETSVFSLYGTTISLHSFVTATKLHWKRLNREFVHLSHC